MPEKGTVGFQGGSDSDTKTYIRNVKYGIVQVLGDENSGAGDS